jgi:GNAT superfamily N-acetyltransferase
MEIIQATPDQIDIIASIMEEGSAVQRMHGFPGWPVPIAHPGILRRFAIGEVFLAYLDGAAVGTFSLQPFDPDFWGEQPDDALYLHKLATRHAVRGRGVGLAMLRWAEQYTHDRGKTYLRLDTLAENDTLCRFYEQAGYVDRGTIRTPTFLARLFEKRVGTWERENVKT